MPVNAGIFYCRRRGACDLLLLDKVSIDEQKILPERMAFKIVFRESVEKCAGTTTAFFVMQFYRDHFLPRRTSIQFLRFTKKPIIHDKRPGLIIREIKASI
jgi:hypothetical protein